MTVSTVLIEYIILDLSLGSGPTAGSADYVTSIMVTLSIILIAVWLVCNQHGGFSPHCKDNQLLHLRMPLLHDLHHHEVNALNSVIKDAVLCKLD